MPTARALRRRVAPAVKVKLLTGLPGLGRPRKRAACCEQEDVVREVGLLRCRISLNCVLEAGPAVRVASAVTKAYRKQTFAFPHFLYLLNRATQ